MIVGGYTLHLYCDDPRHPHDTRRGAIVDVGEFHGSTKGVAIRQATDAGWIFYREGGERKVRCPRCRRKGKDG
jgi:hypothetical protein